MALTSGHPRLLSRIPGSKMLEGVCEIVCVHEHAHVKDRRDVSVISWDVLLEMCSISHSVDLISPFVSNAESPAHQVQLSRAPR